MKRVLGEALSKAAHTLVFSVEVVVENSETFPSVAAPICSTNEVLYYQPNVNECYSIAREKGVLLYVLDKMTQKFISWSLFCVIELFQPRDGEEAVEVHPILYQKFHKVHSIHH